MAHSREKLLKTFPKGHRHWILHLLDKDFKSAILNMPTKLNEIMDQVLTDSRRMLYEKIENINEKREIIKRNHKEILELKSTVPEIKNSLEDFDTTLEPAEKKNHEHEDKSIESIQSEG